MSYTVFATVRLKPEYMEEACKTAAAMVAATQSEDGCITFEPRRAADGSSTIMIFEEWADRAAFDFHHEQDYTKDIFLKYETWLASAPELVEVKALES